MDKDWNIFLEFLGEVTLLVFKNNLRIILGSKSEEVKDIEAKEKVSYSYQKSNHVTWGNGPGEQNLHLQSLWRSKSLIC